MIKIKVLTAVSTMEHPGILKLRASLDRFFYDYSIIVDPNINWNWGGLKHIYEWCKTESGGYTHFLYTDGFDTLALGHMTEVMYKYKDTDCMLFSAEKACFPRSEWAELHTEGNRWRYLNHGQFISPINVFLELYDGVFELPITCQEWAMDKMLNGEKRIRLDLLCNIFQPIAFIADDEYSILDGRIVNNIIPSLPVFAHGNGRSPMEWVYKLGE